MKIDKANSFFDQTYRLENKKETSLDYEAIEQYFLSSEAVMDLEEKYFDQDEDESEKEEENDTTAEQKMEL